MSSQPARPNPREETDARAESLRIGDVARLVGTTPRTG
jgi:hypothetical protein